MFFDSTVYLLFLLIVVAIFWRLKFRAQNWFLLAASYFFYGWWDWRFLGLMALSTMLDFAIARKIEASADERLRKRLLILSLVANFSILGFFKYCNFFVDSFDHVAQAFGMAGIPPLVWKIVLPPAISFYTFQ
jgi:alginate O-acetyltransferase complex protein AlgI